MNTDRLPRFIPSLQDLIIRESDQSTHIFTISDRAEYVPVTDDEAVDAFEYLCKDRGNHPCNRVVTCSRICNEAGTYNGIRTRSSLLLFQAEETRTARQSQDTEGRIFMSKIRSAFEGTARHLYHLSPAVIPILETTAKIVYARSSCKRRRPYRAWYSILRSYGRGTGNPGRQHTAHLQPE